MMAHGKPGEGSRVGVHEDTNFSIKHGCWQGGHDAVVVLPGAPICKIVKHSCWQGGHDVVVVLHGAPVCNDLAESIGGVRVEDFESISVVRVEEEVLVIHVHYSFFYCLVYNFIVVFI